MLPLSDGLWANNSSCYRYVNQLEEVCLRLEQPLHKEEVGNIHKVQESPEPDSDGEKG